MCPGAHSDVLCIKIFEMGGDRFGLRNPEQYYVQLLATLDVFIGLLHDLHQTFKASLNQQLYMIFGP